MDVVETGFANVRQAFSDIEESIESIELWFTSVAEEAAGAGSKALRDARADYSCDLFVIQNEKPLAMRR